jgi:hypothetical protein
MDVTVGDVLWNDHGENGDVRSECELDEGTDVMMEMVKLTGT